MTAKRIDRRAFLTTGAQAGITLCGFCACAQFPLAAFAEEGEKPDEIIDPKKLNYCGYSCPPDCKFLKGTLDNDVELKKEAWKLWKIEERFGVEFDPDQAICYKCKTLDKPEGIVLKRCDVRACAQKKKHESCIECNELQACDKDLWRRFPKFKEQVIAMQERYFQQT